jgi:hypothetical protein
MSKQLKTSKVDEKTDDQLIKETENIKNKTREVGVRILKKCDETEDLAEITQYMLDDQTRCMETIIENLDELDTKVKESKSLAKQFKSWFGIFKSTKSITQYVVKEEKVIEEKNNKRLPEKKERKEYEIVSDDPADEIAEKLSERLDIFAKYADGYKETLAKQSPLLDIMSDKVDKSDCDIKNINNKIKRY